MNPILMTFFLLIFLFSAIGCQSTKVPSKKPSLHTSSATINLIGASRIYDKAQSLYERGNYKGAIEYFHKYVADYPDSELYRVALYYLANSYKETSDFEQAQLLYNRIITLFDKEDFWVDQAKRQLKMIDG